MYGYADFPEYVPVEAPQDLAANDAATEYVDLKDLNWLQFLIQTGNLTSDSTDTITVTVECSTAQTSNAGEQAIAFKYRLSSAIATDSMGALTDATSSGVALTAEDDNKLLVIDIDPAAVAAQEDTQRWVRAVLTTSAGMAITLESAIAVKFPRYPGAQVSTT